MITINRNAVDPQAVDLRRVLFREYQQSLHVDPCFQNFEAELALLPGDYLAPRGRLVLDTLPTMTQAQLLCERLGFVDTRPYTFNPIIGSRYMGLDLTASLPEGNTP